MEQPAPESKGVAGKVGNLVSFFENMGDEPESENGSCKKTVTTSTKQSTQATQDITKFFSGDTNVYQNYDTNNKQENLTQTVESTTVEQHTVNGTQNTFDSRESSSSIVINNGTNGHDAEYVQNESSVNGQIQQNYDEQQSISQSQNYEETTQTTNYQQAIESVEDRAEYQKSYSHQEQSEHRETENYKYVEHREQIERVEEREEHHQREEHSEQIQTENIVVEKEEVEESSGHREYFDQSVDSTQTQNNIYQEQNQQSERLQEGSARYVTDHVRGVSAPSIIAYPFCSVEGDATSIYEALKAKGTDEKSLTTILTKRNEAQRMEIMNQYQQAYGKELLPQLKKKLSGDYEDLILGLFLSKFEILTHDIHASMKGAGTDERTLTEILCTLGDDDINYLKMCYQNAYTKALQDAVYKETSGSYRKVLVSVLSACREDPPSCSEDSVALTLCETDAKGKPSVEETMLRTVLVSYTRSFLYGVFKAYENRTGKEFSHVIKSVCKDGDSRQALLAIYHSILCLPEFYAAELHEAMKGAGTKDSTLRRIILLRAEIDLKDIEKKYEELTGKDFIKTVKSETSGDYRSGLISIIEGNAVDGGILNQIAEGSNQSGNSDRIIFDSQESQL